MPVSIIRAARAFTPAEEIVDAAVVIEDGRIREVAPRAALTAAAGATELDVGDLTIAPGFVDVHIHGAGACDVMEGSVEALRTVTATVARFGTTSIVATTVTAPEEVTCRSLEAIQRFIGQDSKTHSGRAQILGIHLEGPFVSPTQRGVHPADSIAGPSVAKLQRLLQAAGGYARILTLAPELPGALEVIDAAKRAGLIVALGHTDATYAQTCVALEHGADHAVHVFNAMRRFSHRETGVLGAILTDRRVTAEVIADGNHVDTPAIRLLLAAKGPDNVLLVSDGTAATGMPDGEYRLGSFQFTVTNGVCRNAEGRLAGSTLTLDRAVRQLVSMGTGLREALRMATFNPARRLGVHDRKGVLAAGADADLVFLDRDLHVAGVMTRGVELQMSAYGNR